MNASRTPDLPHPPLPSCALPHAKVRIANKVHVFHKVPVRVRFNDSQTCSTLRTIETMVIATSAAEAANWVRDLLDFMPETEIDAWGPRGGRVSRFIGWESAIGANLIRTSRNADFDPAGELHKVLELLTGLEHDGLHLALSPSPFRSTP